MKKEKRDIKSTIIVVLFITWFVASLVCMFIPTTSLFAVGQYFYMFGIITLYQASSSSSDYISFVPLSVGYAIMVATASVHYYNNLSPVLSDISPLKAIYPFIVIIILLIISIVFALRFMKHSDQKKYYWMFLGTNIFSIIILYLLCIGVI